MIIPGFSEKLGIRGMIATENIKCGEVIEIPPLLDIPKEELEIIKTTFLRKYLFETENGATFCLGYGSLYNHSMENNIEVIRKGNRLIFRAKRNIDAGEELLISYGDDEKEVKERYGF